ncbi:MAG: tetratricopeptide repeat protein [Cyclobacteriaceae bacterium]|nr:tetratricopeptide repeat protein [Cyclobacteriaceae bacterium]
MQSILSVFQKRFLSLALTLGMLIFCGKYGYVIANTKQERLSFSKSQIDSINTTFQLEQFTVASDAFEIMYWVYESASELNYNEALAKSANQLGIIYRNTGDHAKALSYFYEAEKVYARLKMDTAAMRVKANLATVYLQSGNLKKAESFYLECAAFFQKHILIADKVALLNNLGSLYLEMGDYELAKARFDRGLALIEENDLDNFQDIYLNMGNLYFLKEEYGLAESYYNKLINSSKSRREDLLTARLNRGDVFYKNDDKDKAVADWEEALSLADELINARLMLRLFERLSQAYLSENNFATAYYYLSSYVKLLNSLYEESANRQIEDLVFTNDLEKKENELELLRQKAEINQLKLKNNRNLLLWMCLVSALLIILSVFIYRRYNFKKAANERLFIQNRQIREINQKLDLQTKLTEDKNKKITDSLHYAGNLQTAILKIEEFQARYPSSFVLYQPKDIVSGDFLWFANLDNDIDLLVCADCTGHGVAGAMMTFLGHSFLDQLVLEKGITSPAEILTGLDQKVCERLINDSHKQHGMDVAICKIDRRRSEVIFAGAKRPLWIYREGSLQVYKGSRDPIGEKLKSSNHPYSEHLIPIQKEDILYLLTDGYADQFGGPKNKKLMVKELKYNLVANASKPLAKQGVYYREYFHNWKKAEEQTDDVLFIGFQLV